MQACAVAATLLVPAACGGVNDDSSRNGQASETQLTWYSSASEDYIRQMADVFEKSHPDIKVTTFSQTAASLLEHFKADAARGKPQADILQVSPAEMNPAIQADLIQKFTPSSAAALPKKYESMAPYAYPDRLLEHVVVYNTDNVSASDAKILNTWQGVVDARWKGRIVFPDPNLNGGWHNAFYMLWKKYGDAWVKKLNALDPVRQASNSPTAEAVVSGQKDIGLVIANYASTYIAKGAPIRVVFPSPTPTWAGEIALVKNAPHESAAKTFLNWWFTKEAQTEWGKIYQVAVPLPGVPYESALAKASWYEPPKSRLVLDTSDMFAHEKEFLSDWNEIFGGPPAAQ